MASDCLKLELRAVVSCLMWLLGTEHSCSGRAARALKHSSLYSSTVFFEMDSLTKLELTDWTGWAGWPVSPRLALVSNSPGLQIQTWAAVPTFYKTFFREIKTILIGESWIGPSATINLGFIVSM